MMFRFYLAHAMYPVLKHLWLVVLLSAVLAAACSPAAPANTATIAVAANFKPAMDKLEIAFEAETGHQIILVIGSTGALYAQIQQGAPFDVLLGADTARPALLETEGLGVAGTRFTYAIGQLVLWRPEHEPVTVASLSAPNLRHIALANPKHAPYGAAAMSVLQSQELEDDLTDRLVVGENVGQAMVFVQTGNADLGFVALSQVLALPAKDQGAYWSVPAALYPPIRQDGVLLKRAAGNPVAQDFMAFMQSAKAREIITNMGYIAP